MERTASAVWNGPLKEGKGTIKWTRMSCRTFAANAVRLQLHGLAYNLGNFMRTLAIPKAAHLVPDGRGRGAATDVRRYPIADRPAASATRASMSSAVMMRTRQGEK